MGSVQLTVALVLLVCRSVFGSEDRIQQLERVSKQLARQLMLQQLYVEEQSRSGGDSGLKQIRMRTDGTKSYFTATHTEKTVASMHDHSEFVRTSGLGEMVAVLNGVEFRTRHNDYKLVMPSKSSQVYHATEDIPFPDVPLEVGNQSSFDMQIYEMRQWFQAWKEGDPTERDYRKYFKPLLCYLEGAWTTDVTTIDEPFKSDRHHIAAGSWLELQNKIRFTAYTGDKNQLENFAYLPTTIMNVTDDGVPHFGQWNYRILCHPIKDIDLKLTHLKVVDDLANRLSTDNRFDSYLATRGARFRVSQYSEDQEHRWDLLDRLMKQIPGLDNYGASIKDGDYDVKKLDVFDEKELNTAYYHRWYKLTKKGANGDKFAHRSFADRGLFVAETTQPRVAPASYQHCVFPNSPLKRSCTIIEKRFSYAIPLEIIWLTPLNSWNPFGIEYKGEFDSGPAVAVYGENNIRNGGLSKEKAYNGTHSKAYYRTPVQFFAGGEVDADAADTTPKGSVGVLDRETHLRAVKSSGIRIILPEIPGVGVLRTRFPIMPVHAEGSTIWKEMEALRDIVMDMSKYLKFFETRPPFGSGSDAAPTVPPVIHTVLHTSLSTSTLFPKHEHTISLIQRNYNILTRKKKTLSFLTSKAGGHTHTVFVAYDSKTQKFLIKKCDGRALCPDGHNSTLTPEA